VAILDDHPTSISARLDALVRDVLIDQGYPNRTEVTVHTVGVDVITERNFEAFGKQGPTDVVSFPVEDLTPGAVPMVDADGPPVLLGDVFIAPEIVTQRALSNGFEPDAELALMTVHGVLHLMGYDHLDDEAADAMESIETRILERHGFGRR
jgi:probable rRNA maturation factor